MNWKMSSLFVGSGRLLLLALVIPTFTYSFSLLSNPRITTRTTIREFDKRRVLERRAFASPLLGVQIAETVQPSVALITPIGVRNTTARGSGFCIDWSETDDDVDDATGSTNCTYFITAAHVAAPGFRLNVTTTTTTTTVGDSSDSSSSWSRPATVVERDATLDLAILRLENSNGYNKIRPLQIMKEYPPVGSLAFAHGYPASRMQGPAMTCGIVCGIAKGLGLPDDNNNAMTNFYSPSSIDYPITNRTAFVVTDAAMAGGMSGGPLVDMTGAVIGVNALIRPDLRALGNYAVSAKELIGFLHSVKARRKERSVDDTPPLFRVVLYNDNRNKRERITSVLKEVANLDVDDASSIMMQAHTTGKGVVGDAMDKDAATKLYLALQQKDVLVEVEAASDILLAT